MSWSYCAISGDALHEPVVSKKSGHVFEKRVIEKYISSTGQCPITGQALAADDLISVNLANQTKPRSVTMNSVPGILKSFQSEWDALMLETFTLKQHLETVRQELSHALYQHDAACRVIARLISERDDARREVSSLQEKLEQSRMEVEEVEEQRKQEHSQESHELVLPKDVIESINSTAISLSTLRKERKKDTEYNSKFASQQVNSAIQFLSDTKEQQQLLLMLGILMRFISKIMQQIASFSVKGEVQIQGNGENGLVTAVDLSRATELAISAGNNGNIAVSNLFSNAETASIRAADSFIGLAILSDNANNVIFVVLSQYSAVVYDYSVSLKSFTVLYEVKQTALEFTSVAAHPNGTLFVLGAKNGQFQYHEINKKSGVLSVSDLVVNRLSITSVQIHPDGNLLGVGCSDGSVKLWNIAMNEMLTSLEDGVAGAVDLIRFSENGFTLAVGSIAARNVKIFDLRKAKCVKSIDNVDLVTLEFDLSGSVLAIGMASGKIILVETKKWGDVAAFETHSTSVTAIRFNGFSQKMVSVSQDSKLNIFSL